MIDDRFAEEDYLIDNRFTTGEFCKFCKEFLLKGCYTICVCFNINFCFWE